MEKEKKPKKERSPIISAGERYYVVINKCKHSVKERFFMANTVEDVMEWVLEENGISVIKSQKVLSDSIFGLGVVVTDIRK